MKPWLRPSKHGSFDESDVRLAAVVLLGGAFLVALASAWRGGDLVRYRTDILISVIVAIAIAFVLEISPLLFRRLLERKEHREFVKFFGSDAVDRPVTIVFSERYSKDDPQWNFPAHSPKYPDAWHSLDPNSKYCAEGVDHWIAKQDVVGAGALAHEFAAHSRHSPDFVLESKVDESDLIGGDRCIISMGLGFNSRTAMIADQCFGELFYIAWGKSPKNRILTDLLTFGGRLLGDPGPGLDHAVVARVVIEGRPHFVCAGRTADGTAVAGRYLAKNWRDMLAKYERRSGKNGSLRRSHDLCRHSLAVLLTHKVGSTGASNSSTVAVVDECWWPDEARAFHPDSKRHVPGGGRGTSTQGQTRGRSDHRQEPEEMDV